jgi:hypothetical protein
MTRRTLEVHTLQRYSVDRPERLVIDYRHRSEETVW